MTIVLPENFYYGNDVKIENGILKIPIGICWRDFVYKLAIADKGENCWYCGKKLRKEEITMDHLYPQDLGGPTIPINLAPTCLECNNRKGNLTEYQYRNLRKAPERQKKAIRAKFLATNEWYKQKKGYFLPKQWITSRKIDTVLATFIMGESYLGKKYSKIEMFYRGYGHIPYPIIVDRNGYLLDGFLVLMLAKNHEITRVPTIILENVEVVFDKMNF